MRAFGAGHPRGKPAHVCVTLLYNVLTNRTRARLHTVTIVLRSQRTASGVRGVIARVKLRDAVVSRVTKGRLEGARRTADANVVVKHGTVTQRQEVSRIAAGHFLGFTLHFGTIAALERLLRARCAGVVVGNRTIAKFHKLAGWTTGRQVLQFASAVAEVGPSRIIRAIWARHTERIIAQNRWTHHQIEPLRARLLPLFLALERRRQRERLEGAIKAVQAKVVLGCGEPKQVVVVEESRWT
jgi:hypothetical protein